MAALPAGWVHVVVVDVLLGGRGGRGAAAIAAAGLAHLHLLGLLRVRYRSAVGQVGVVGVGGVQLRSHLLLLLLLLLRLLLARQGQSQDLITYRQPAGELADLRGLFERFWKQEEVSQTPHDPAMMEQPAVCRWHRHERQIFALVYPGEVSRFFFSFGGGRNELNERVRVNYKSALKRHRQRSLNPVRPGPGGGSPCPPLSASNFDQRSAHPLRTEKTSAKRRLFSLFSVSG